MQHVNDQLTIPWPKLIRVPLPVLLKGSFSLKRLPSVFFFMEKHSDLFWLLSLLILSLINAEHVSRYHLLWVGVKQTWLGCLVWQQTQQFNIPVSILILELMNIEYVYTNTEDYHLRLFTGAITKLLISRFSLGGLHMHLTCPMLAGQSDRAINFPSPQVL